jgi:hypothetical protein
VKVPGGQEVVDKATKPVVPVAGLAGRARPRAGTGRPELPVVLTTFAKANPGDFETRTRQELTRLGWRAGDNRRLAFRCADNRPERLDELARAGGAATHGGNDGGPDRRARAAAAHVAPADGRRVRGAIRWPPAWPPACAGRARK